MLVPSAAELVALWDMPLAMMGARSFDGYFTMVNPGYSAVLGWSEDELMSVPYWEFLHPDDQLEMVEAGDQLMQAGGTRLGYEVRMLCRDGSYRWIRWNTRAVPEEQRLYYIGIDVTSSKPASDERAAVATWDWDVVADVVTWSDELYAMFGLPAGTPNTYETVLGRVHPDDHRPVDHQLRWALVSGDLYYSDFRVVLPGGDIRLLHTAGRVTETNTEGDPRRMRGITLDITDRGR